MPTTTPPTATPGVTPPPTVAPTPSPATPIEQVRLLPDGATVTVEGVLTTALGALESARSGFAQDASGGIALYLDAPFEEPVPAGALVVASGMVDTRYGQRTLRVSRADILVLGEASVPDAMSVSTGAATEPLEGRRLEVGGTITSTPDALADGLGLTIDDGTGPLRVIAGDGALGGAAPRRGDVVVARGPLGQRDSTGTGTEGYRLHATLPGELLVEVPPSPTPTVAPSTSPTPTPGTSASPSPTPPASGTPVPSASPFATPGQTVAPLSVAAARLVPVDREAFVRGVVVAEPGRLGTPSLFVIADTTGGLPVRLPDGVAAPTRGMQLEVRGRIAEPYGQTEVRPGADAVHVIGTGSIPPSLTLAPSQAGETTEGRLATIRGTLTASPTRATSGDVSFTIAGSDGSTLRILADASASLDLAALRKGTTATFTGIVGQRASRKGALDGYRLWVRDRLDIAAITQPVASSTPSGAPSATSSPASDAVIRVAAALDREGQRVTVEGVLTVGRTLLDASGRRTIVQDSSGAIEAYLPEADAALRQGARVRLTGTVGRAWGAPRLKVERARVLGSGTAAVLGLTSAPGEAAEWRLVRIAGTLASVKRSGDRWTAELTTARGVKLPVAGLAGSGIAAESVQAGRSATVTGIVKRPYPTATDRRFAIVPRSPGDLALGGSLPAASPGASDRTAVTPAGTAGGGIPGPSTSAGGVPDVDLRDLVAHLGNRVRVGGLVTTLEADGLRLDDATAVTRLVLEDAAAPVLDVVGPGDALNAIGVPEQREEVVLVVMDAADVVLVGDLGGAVEPPAPAASAASPDPAQEALRASLGRGMGLDATSAGLGTMALVLALSVAVTLARRHRAQRLLRARIVARLETFVRVREPAHGVADPVRTPPPVAAADASAPAAAHGPILRLDPPA